MSTVLYEPHQCPLPWWVCVPYGQIVRCDTCGRIWRRGSLFGDGWVRLWPFGRWLYRRQIRGGK